MAVQLLGYAPPRTTPRRDSPARTAAPTPAPDLPPLVVPAADPYSFAGVERNLGDPPSSYAIRPATTTTDTSSDGAASSTDSATPAPLIDTGNVPGVTWICAAAGVVVVLMVLTWRLIQIRRRYRAFPPSLKPPLTTSYILRSYLLPRRGIRCPLPFGLAGGKLEIDPAPFPPPLSVSRTPTVSDDGESGRVSREQERHRMAVLVGAGAMGVRGAARHAHVEERRRSRSRQRRRRRRTSGADIDRDGRRLGSGDGDDGFAGEEEAEDGQPKHELPAYRGLDPALPVYADSFPIARPEPARLRTSDSPRPPPRRSSYRLSNGPPSSRETSESREGSSRRPSWDAHPLEQPPIPEGRPEGQEAQEQGGAEQEEEVIADVAAYEASTRQDRPEG